MSATVSAGGYELYHSENGIEVYGKWKYEKPFKKGKLMLCLKVVNTRDAAAFVELDVNFFDAAVLSETMELDSLCIEAGKKLKGRRDRLCFISEEFSNEGLLAEGFHWRVDDLEVKETTGCKPQ